MLPVCKLKAADNKHAAFKHDVAQPVAACDGEVDQDLLQVHASSFQIAKTTNAAMPIA